MIIVDSSIWIDYFNDKDTLQTTHLDFLLGEQDYPLLFSDKDFQPFVEHLSLRPAFAH